MGSTRAASSATCRCSSRSSCRPSPTSPACGAALIAFVKDILIYLVILVAVLLRPRARRLGRDLPRRPRRRCHPNPATGAPTGSILLTANNQLQYVTLALGSALALFLYPHSITGILASRGRNVIKRNMVALPAYSLLLGLLALLGYVAIAAGVKPITNNATGRPDTNTIIPVLSTRSSARCSRASFAAIGIGAPVPPRSCPSPRPTCGRATSGEYLKRDATPRRRRDGPSSRRWWSSSGPCCSCARSTRSSPSTCMIGGVIILQTLPAVAIALYTWLPGGRCGGLGRRHGLQLYLLWIIPNPANGRLHFGGSALTWTS